MGNSTSKAVRRLPKTQSKQVPKATESLDRLKNPSTSHDEPHTKPNAAMKDGQDPDFMNNLSKIDPVKIEKAQTNFRPSDKMINILRGRKVESEVDNAAMAYNRLSPQSLLVYLEERKNGGDVGQLNRSFNVNDSDAEIIEKYTAAPTTGTPFTVKVDENSGEIQRVIVSL
ncbi:hypothetical protein E3P81_03259 [Wallemia ichthyophaga]|uniref:Uncharacterized protein n=1 Tax=Wallemia ichthyophaga (strain EXF-994 / CBS 113033) TaxID=1299270 RepID=R9AEW7_WALI9|nr:uncharacterized protein J056_000490 [Wallemia ichthyophaga EXF-994]TIA90758.1 hypothetical protein E3P97_02397 [Wallemia ichthyophaga]EOR00680.1 hypothetical protein J056_000490 [Wallemia ichthyophaga EXF-994]TIB29757.1 hypothetical protein E3P85_03016 [Wallemia ichthyophaga]TIB44928.1 hypothetical protein E3P82_03264 [Wallemia ichthyophaga]TIB47539.1 hypothetical protein E3P81_03259 [Wallemia ichthyophaga]